MIHTSTQLKALVRNRSKGDSTQAQLLIRNYMMERFLERLSLSKYQDNFILKGGTLISAMVGVDVRSTLDIDTSLRGLPLTVDKMMPILEEIVAIPVEDGVNFQITRVSEIMEEAEYPGIRVMLEAALDRMKTPLKLDISTGDAITPKEISYPFKLMFEERIIQVLAYNVETVLAEKLESILSKGTAGTRMRDYYDVYVLQGNVSVSIDTAFLQTAYSATCKKRGRLFSGAEVDLILQEIRESADMQILWRHYQKKFDYAAEIAWETVMDAVSTLYHWAVDSVES